MPQFHGWVSGTCQDELLLFRVDDADGVGVKEHNATCITELSNGEQKQRVTFKVGERWVILA